ncbi:MAG: hypothetical protein R3E96_08235 [Planctomycetota bacterium]
MDADKDALAALAQAAIADRLEGMQIVKTIVVARQARELVVRG